MTKKRTGHLSMPVLPESGVSPAVPSSAENWLRLEFGDDAVDAPLVRRALRRLADDDVAMTGYGWRVTSRPELGDDDTRKAYWPKESDRNHSGWWCRCRWGRSNRLCSHILAVKLAEAGFKAGHAYFELVGEP